MNQKRLDRSFILRWKGQERQVQTGPSILRQKVVFTHGWQVPNTDASNKQAVTDHINSTLLPH